MKKSIIAITMLSALSANVQAAADQGKGTVTFTGTIIEAPCSIKAEEVNQTVQLGQVAVGTLKKNGESVPQRFNITLEGCDTSALSSVDVKFTGSTIKGQTDLLSIRGLAKGVGVQISKLTASEEAPIEFGTATTVEDLVDGTNTLSFSAKLKPTGENVNIVPGEFTALANFALAYK